MKKKLNVDTIQSELRGGSAFFPGYKSPDSPTSTPEIDTQTDTVDTPLKEINQVAQQENPEGVPPSVPHTHQANRL